MTLFLLVLVLMQPLKSANMKDVVQEWYANFVAVDQDVLFELILTTKCMIRKHF